MDEDLKTELDTIKVALNTLNANNQRLLMVFQSVLGVMQGAMGEDPKKNIEELKAMGKKIDEIWRYVADLYTQNKKVP